MTTQRLNETRRLWDNEAATFDDEPDHGLRDSIIREAWTDRFVTWLPSTASTVLDIGCGTGSLSVLLASLGHRVTGADLSPAMIAQAQAKATAAGHRIDFSVMDAANPQIAPRQFGVIVCRHLLWALPEPAQALRHWVDLLKPGGRLVLIEGCWYTNAGLRPTAILNALPPSLTDVSVENLSDQSDLWGRVVTDERYIVRATLSASISGEPHG